MRQNAKVAELPARRTLADIVASLDGRGPAGAGAVGRTIFAERPWGPDSLAVVLREDPHRGRAATMPTYACLLEVDHASQVLDVWSSRRAGAVPSPAQAAEALIHYAAHRAHQPMTCLHYGCGRPEATTCSTCGRSMCHTHAVGPASAARCPWCSSTSPVGKPSTLTSVARAARASGGPSSVVAVAGAGGVALGLVIQLWPLAVGGACLLVIGTCVWLGAFVQRIME